jgi:hypothetical protein
VLTGTKAKKEAGEEATAADATAVCTTIVASFRSKPKESALPFTP